MMRPLPLATSLDLFACVPLVGLHAYQQTADAPAPQTAEPAPAAVAAPAGPVVGDPDHGRLLTYTCQGCHGVTGYKNAYPSFRVPKIGGQSAEYLSAALHGYKQGTRKHPTMQAQSESFSDQDIADIAAYLSTLK